jgi:Zn-dependent protease with chaperone function
VNEIRGHYYDGRTSARHEVVIELGAGSLRLRGAGIDRSFSFQAIRASAPLGRTARSLYFVDGSKCETEDSAILNDWLARLGDNKFSRLRHRFEQRFGYALLALAMTAALVWLAIGYGVPALAKSVAFRLPPSVEGELGEQALQGLDGMIFAPSALPEARQAGLREKFAEVIGDLPRGMTVRLEFRSSDAIGANAFTLPAGTIVVTDDLVALAHNDEEIVAVLAHELGHVVNRHVLRQILQDSIGALLIAAVIGDMTSITALAAGVPTLLLESKYSRDFEREADAYALEYLRARGIDDRHFRAILARLEEQGGDGVPDFLATHPSAEERIALD